MGGIVRRGGPIRLPHEERGGRRSVALTLERCGVLTCSVLTPSMPWVGESTACCSCSRRTHRSCLDAMAVGVLGARRFRSPSARGEPFLRGETSSAATAAAFDMVVGTLRFAWSWSPLKLGGRASHCMACVERTEKIWQREGKERGELFHSRARLSRLPPAAARAGELPASCWPVGLASRGLGLSASWVPDCANRCFPWYTMAARRLPRAAIAYQGKHWPLPKKKAT